MYIHAYLKTKLGLIVIFRKYVFYYLALYMCVRERGKEKIFSLSNFLRIF